VPRMACLPSVTVFHPLRLDEQEVGRHASRTVLIRLRVVTLFLQHEFHSQRKYVGGHDEVFANLPAPHPIF